MIVKVKTFKDPEFCGGPVNGEHQDCQFLVFNEDCCLFLDKDGDFTPLDWKENSLGEEIATKCIQCKETEKPAQLDKLLSKYWDIAYTEGKEGRTHDTIRGDAQNALVSIHAEVERMMNKSVKHLTTIEYI